MERHREKKRKISVGNSWKSVFPLSKMIFSNFFLILIEIWNIEISFKISFPSIFLHFDFVLSMLVYAPICPHRP
jgi:hypothetical protein